MMELSFLLFPALRQLFCHLKVLFFFNVLFIFQIRMCLEFLLKLCFKKCPIHNEYNIPPFMQIILFVVSHLREHIILNMTVNSQFKVVWLSTVSCK